MRDKNLHHWVALNSLQELTPRLGHALLNKLQSPEAIFSAPAKTLKEIEGMTQRAFHAITSFDKDDWVEQELASIQTRGVNLIHWGSPEYPPQLANIYDPPLLLYVKGEIIPDDHIALAMVGARKASAYGLRAANRLAASAAEHRLTLVSGMARGIDTEVHRTALKHGGRTIAVLGSGLEFIYPPENRRLYHEIITNGAVISEFPLLAPPEAYNFPRRNRIISGLSIGTVVIEAGERSGSLITARYALEQGREVFAVAGSIESSTSSGTHRLIQDGAKLVREITDILDELPQISSCQIGVLKKKLSQIEEWLLETLEQEPQTVDCLVAKSTFSLKSISSAVSKLELEGLVRQIHGNRFMREA